MSFEYSQKLQGMSKLEDTLIGSASDTRRLDLGHKNCRYISHRTYLEFHWEIRG